MYFTRKDGSQSTFTYQLTLETLELKKQKCVDYVFSWKSNGVYNSKPKPLHTSFLQSINLSAYKLEIKFDQVSLAVEQNNYLSNYLFSIINNYLFQILKLLILSN